jgi:branched-chain amino acid transport system substrate-binding protein
MAITFRSRKLLPWFAALVIGIWAFGPIEAQAQKQEITVGYSLSLTGRFSTEATDVHKAYQYWAEEINKQGGLYLKELNKKLPIKLVHYDDSSDTNGAVKNYERLITRDEVDLLLSPWGSGINFAVSALTEKYKYPVIMTSAAANNIFGRGFKYMFETTQLASNLLVSIVDFLASKKDQVKTLAIAYENFLFTQSLHDTLKPRFEKAGLSIVADEQYPLGGQDFTSLLTKIKGAKPDAFLVLNIMPSSVYMTRQMNEVGLKPKFYAVNIGPMFEEEFIGKLGKITEGTVDTGFWHPDLPFPGARKFFDSFTAKYNKKPSTDAAYAYIATQVLTQAIEQAGTVDREKLAETLHSGKFTTIMGPYEYDERGVNKHQLSFLCQVQNGHRVIVWPKEVATAEPRFPLPQ